MMQIGQMKAREENAQARHEFSKLFHLKFQTFLFSPPQLSNPELRVSFSSGCLNPAALFSRDNST